MAGSSNVKRKPITDKMKMECLLYRGSNLCSICKEPLGPWDEIEWDHIFEFADGGPHSYINLRPLHPDCHKKKTAKACKQRAHIKRLAAGPKPKRKTWAKRPFPKRVKP